MASPSSSSTTPPTPPRILLTGATGYIGGTILHTLLTTPSPSHALPITCLLRSPSAAALLTSTYGPSLVQPVLYAGLDDLPAATAAAATAADIVINAALGYHAAAAHALIRGLAQRQRQHPPQTTPLHPPYYIHLSGASNLADRSLSGAWTASPRTFDDCPTSTFSIHAWQRTLDSTHPYIQRTAELSSVALGLELGVRTVVIMPPLVWGRGTGTGKRESTQVPAYVRVAARRGRAVVMGDGRGEWDHVHVEDLGGLYRLVVEAIVAGGGGAGAGVPVGEEGVVFAADGRQSWREVAEAVGEVGVAEGRLRDAGVDEVSVGEGTRLFAEAYLGEGVDEEMVELGLASHGRTVPSVARSLGWKPTNGGEEAWRRGLREDIKVALQSC
ncbi:nad dependent epimerase dehydratase family protein [Diplodia corticola]|uniref:Nad dependent epimerase dehydratase family protein n=1 Tax=Diplodia corticola TaxID=236234 RepID=A0A1J9R304_9PEZI|nr:nad dependent epimerase dehydratase family protein [Diplodia corticola]OJD34992.1 nad dependent epimerase dehydratase family protein [Diplodia corticola]